MSGAGTQEGGPGLSGGGDGRGGWDGDIQDLSLAERVSDQASVLPPTLTIRPNRPISDLRFTLADLPRRMAGKVNLRSEIGQFVLIS